jgi:hypothetical protein
VDYDQATLPRTGLLRATRPDAQRAQRQPEPGSAGTHGHARPTVNQSGEPIFERGNFAALRQLATVQDTISGGDRVLTEPGLCQVKAKTMVVVLSLRDWLWA